MATTHATETMSSKQRLVTALDNKTPDRLPVTTHHVMPYFLNKYLNGMDNDAFFDHFGLDPIRWTGPAIVPESSDWEITSEEIPNQDYPTVRYTIHTPKGDLTGVLQSNEHTMWMTEHLVKGPEDVDKVAYAPAPTLDVAALNKEAEAFGERGLIRGHITGFDIMGQPGTWQDATCLMPVDELSVQCLTDPDWVHALLGILYERKRVWVESLDGAKYDVLELGGGAASSTVISPYIFEEFVAPYDKQLIDLAHEKGQRIAYHTCGGMMPFLELIADMNPDAMETFTPAGMGGDADLAEAKQRIGGRVCMIGGWDQLHFFQDCSEEAVRAEVRRCFEAAGPEGGFILAPSDHFFDAEPELVMAFADEARKCAY